MEHQTNSPNGARAPDQTLTTTLEEIAEAVADYATPRPFDFAAQNAMQDRIADEIIALTGCDPHVASIAGGGFVNFRSAPDWSLNDGTPAGSSGLYVLRRWLAEKVSAYRAAQTRAAA